MCQYSLKMLQGVVLKWKLIVLLVKEVCHILFFCISSYSTSFSPLVPAVAPKNVSLFRSEDGRSIVVVWIPLTLVEAKGFIQYVISLSVSGSTVKRQSPLTMTVSGNEATFRDLDPSTDYDVSVSTFTSSGETGPGKVVQYIYS